MGLQITIHTFVHENVKDFMHGFRYDAHPMGMLVASVGALSPFYPDANQIHDPEIRAIQIIRLIAKMPTLVAFAFRHNMGQPYVYPDDDLEYPGNFLSMMYKMTELKYQPDPRLARALDYSLILHADHEQNASTSAVRNVGSTQVDPYSAVAAALPRSTGRSTAGPTSRRWRCCAGSARSTTSPPSSTASRPATSASWASAIASTRTTTPARASSASTSTPSSRSAGATR